MISGLVALLVAVLVVGVTRSMISLPSCRDLRLAARPASFPSAAGRNRHGCSVLVSSTLIIIAVIAVVAAHAFVALKCGGDGGRSAVMGFGLACGPWGLGRFG